jgi:putative membrane protein
MLSGVTVVAMIFAGLAGVFHLLIFVMESLLFSRPTVYRRFLVEPEALEGVRPWALNQGFYNLFLGLGALGGLASWDGPGQPVSLFACGCMAGAAVVLLSTDRRLVRPALLQGVPPLLALAAASIA